MALHQVMRPSVTETLLPNTALLSFFFFFLNPSAIELMQYRQHIMAMDNVVLLLQTRLVAVKMLC